MQQYSGAGLHVGTIPAETSRPVSHTLHTSPSFTTTGNRIRLSASELFAGGGGLGLGAAQLGITHRLFVDACAAACDTLRANSECYRGLDLEYIVEDDVRRIDFSSYQPQTCFSQGHHASHGHSLVAIVDLKMLATCSTTLFVQCEKSNLGR